MPDSAHSLHLKTGRLLYLEGMRGLAALSVVFSHLALTFFPLSGSTALKDFENVSALGKFLVLTPISITFNGHLAVLLFFVHSGLVLSYGFFANGKDQNRLISSAGARYVRLTAPMAASIFLAYALHRLGFFSIQETSSITGSAWLYPHYNFTPSFWEALKQSVYSTYYSFNPLITYNSSLWTIATEFAGSFVVYGFLSLFGALRKRWLAHFVVLFIYHRAQIFPMLLGMFFCDVYLNVKFKQVWLKKVSKGWFPPFILAVGIYAASFKSVEFPMYSVFQFVRIELREYISLGGASLIVISLLLFPGAQWLLTRKPILFLGRISYSIYLLHIPILCSFTCSLFLLLHKHTSLGYHPIALLCALTTVLLIIGCSYLFCILVDEVSIDMAKKLFHKYFQRKNFSTSPSTTSVQSDYEQIIRPSTIDIDRNQEQSPNRFHNTVPA